MPVFFGNILAFDLQAFAVGGVAKMAEHGAFLGVGDFGVEGFAFADGVDEVLEVRNVAEAGHVFFHEFAGVVVDAVTAAVE